MPSLISSIIFALKMGQGLRSMDQPASYALSKAGHRVNKKLMIILFHWCILLLLKDYLKQE